MKDPTAEELQRCKDFLTYFGVNHEGDTIYLTDGGNSVVMNPNTEWHEFLGCSINGVAETVAKYTGKQVKWRD